MVLTKFGETKKSVKTTIFTDSNIFGYKKLSYSL